MRAAAWLRARWRRLRRADRDAGYSTAELVVIAPVIVVLLLFVVGLGRYSSSKQLVEQAAMAAGRAASQGATAQQAADRAQAAGAASLDDAGISCVDFSMVADTGDFQPGGSVTVTLTCTASLSGLVLSGLPGSTTVSASSTVPLEIYRQYGGN